MLTSILRSSHRSHPYVTIAIPVGCNLFSNIPDATTSRFDRVTQGGINACIGIPCIVSDEQYFWYQFWLNRIIRITFDKRTTMLHGVNDTWMVAHGRIQHNVAYITPYAEFTNQRNVAILYGAGRHRDMQVDLSKFVAISMAMNDSVLY